MYSIFCNKFESFLVRLQLYTTHVIYFQNKKFRCHNDFLWKLYPHRIIILHLYRHTHFSCILLYWVSNKLKASIKSLLSYFPASICSLHVSVTSGNPHNISSFSLDYIDMVICDVTIVMVLGCHKPCSYKTVNCVWTIYTSHFLPLPSLCVSLFPEITILKFRQLITQNYYSAHGKEKSHTSHFKSKARMTEFSEEGMLHTETG